ncbi:MAG: phage portal protein [Taibaiella sp.]|jgi:capsid protein
MRIKENIKAMFGIAESARISAPAQSVKQQLVMQGMSDAPIKEARFDNGGSGYYNTFFAYSFNGEKNEGDIGPIRDYYIDYQALRARSWQAFLESDICQLLLSKKRRWVIGKGLKLQSEPQVDTLLTEGIVMSDDEVEDFNDQVESRFETYCASTMADHANMKSLHKLAKTAYMNAIIGGDVLVIMRLNGTTVTVQLVDGAHVDNPGALSMVNGQFQTTNGNVVRNGIEMDVTGRHVAYHVRNGIFSTERIPAYGEKTGREMAFMVNSPLEFRLDNNRSLPLLAAVLETAAKMDRYKEATLGSAEEGAKIVYSIEHEAYSDGSNPQLQELARRMAGQAGPVTVDGKELAKTVAATTNKQAVNMPLGAKLSAFESKKELYFKDFFTVNIGIVSALIDMPVDVALSDYKSNYSSSRAGIQDFGHGLEVDRDDFAPQFYKKIYDFWLYVQVLTNKVQAPEYLTAMQKRNRMAVEAYGFSRWVGTNVPHIDPLKEVQAARLLLGTEGAHIPLSTVEAVTEKLGNGGSYSNIQQFGKELKVTDKAGIEKSEITAPVEKTEEKDE